MYLNDSIARSLSLTMSLPNCTETRLTEQRAADLVIELKCTPEKGGSAVVGKRAKIQPELDGRSRNEGAEREREREIWIQLPELIAPFHFLLPSLPHFPSSLQRI